MLDGLEAQQLIERQADEYDRRVKKIVLTPCAVDLIERIESIATTLRKEVFAGITEQEIALCQSIQARMLTNLEKRNET